LSLETEIDKESAGGQVRLWSSGQFGFLSDYLWWWVASASLVLHAWCFFRFFPRARYPRAFLVAANGLMVACLLAFAGLAAESYLRFLSTSTDSFGATLTCKRWKAAYAPTNSLGHRDREWSEEKPPGVRRIAFVGDSFVYGWGINDPKNRFPDRIQKKFDDRRPGTVEIMNVAWADWDTRDQARAVESMTRTYAIDEIVLCHLPNDIEKILPHPPDHDPTRPPQSVFLRTDASFLLDYLFHRVYATRVSRGGNYFDWIAGGYADEQYWRQHQENLARIVLWCREEGILLRAALLPFLKTAGSRYDAAWIHVRLRTFFESNNVPVVDLLPAVAGRNPTSLVVNAHDAHPNELANGLFADAIWTAFFANPVD
jgi:lysophospholipase L1-like esterase